MKTSRTGKAFLLIFFMSAILFTIGYSLHGLFMIGVLGTEQSAVMGSSPQVIEITAFEFGWKPEIVRINLWEHVIFKIKNEGVVTHGIYIDGYDLKLDIPPGETRETEPIVFNKLGKLKIRCAITCGPLHPFMVADIIVEPNIPLYAFMFSTLAVAGGALFYVGGQPQNKMLGFPLEKEIDLLKIKRIGPILKKALQWRGVHYALIWPNALIFAIVITTGFFGNPIGNKNFSIAVVWILWLTAVEFMILFAARTWCTVCPMPAFGEWLARRRLYGVHRLRKWMSLNKKWPSNWNNMWVTALGFLSISLIVPWLVTRPLISGLLFVFLIALGLIFHLIFPQRYFCRHICPASGYIGTHSNISFYAVRSKDRKICDECFVKGCIRGSPEGYGCPWTLYPGGLEENTYCGLCYECLKSCPMDNMTVKLRMIGQEIATIAAKGKHKVSEAWMEFVRFTLATFYWLALFGPYWFLKDWGNMGVNFGANLLTAHLLIPTLQGLRNWFVWAIIVTAVCIIIYPAIFYCFSWIAKRAAGAKEYRTRDVFVPFAFALSPYGLFLWVGFTLSLVLVNWAYPVSAFSDPLGWGWNLLGTKFAWQPIIPDFLPYIITVVVSIGLALAINSTYNIACKLFSDHKKAFRATVVMGLLHTMAGLVFIWIVAG